MKRIHNYGQGPKLALGVSVVDMALGSERQDSGRDDLDISANRRGRTIVVGAFALS